MIFVSFRCFFSVFHVKILGSVYATPTERLRYALATPFLPPCSIKRKNRPQRTILQWGITGCITTAVLHTFFARWTVSFCLSNGRTAHSLP